MKRPSRELRSPQVQRRAERSESQRSALPEGWTFYTEPAPQFKNVTDSGSTEGSYYTWVDQFDTLGLGRNVPINTGNATKHCWR